MLDRCQLVRRFAVPKPFDRFDGGAFDRFEPRGESTRPISASR